MSTIELPSRLDVPTGRERAVVGGLVAAALGLRLLAAALSHLDPDEAMHLVWTDHSSLAGTLRDARTSAHPPLYFILLWAWRTAGDSVVWLRLPSVVAGAATVWAGWCWLRCAVGRPAALIAAGLLAVNPAAIQLSAELRPYALMLLLVFMTLATLEAGARRSDPRLIVVSTLALLLAIGLHYSALWVAVAMALAGFVRLTRAPASRRLWRTWWLCQTAIAGACLALYAGPIAQLRGGSMEARAIDGWLREWYFHPGEESLPRFAVASLAGLFVYLVGNPLFGLLAAPVYVATTVVLCAGRHAGGAGEQHPRSLGLLLLAPLAIGLAAALLQIYPFGGSRHSAWLLPFVTGGLSIAIAATASRPRVLAPLLGLVVGFSVSAAVDRTRLEHRDDMHGLLECLETTVLCGDLIVVDQQMDYLLRYYLPRWNVAAIGAGDAFESASGCRVIAACDGVWELQGENFRTAVREAAAAAHRRPASGVWVCLGGWHTSSRQRAWIHDSPLVDQRSVQSFGAHLFLFRVRVERL